MLFSSRGPGVKWLVSKGVFISPPQLPATGSRLSRRALLSAATPLDTLLGLGPAPPPRRTASAEAYSTTSLRPSRWWFLGCTKAAVACSEVVKSTNANLVSHLMSMDTGIYTWCIHLPFAQTAILERPHTNLPYPGVLRQFSTRILSRGLCSIFWLRAVCF